MALTAILRATTHGWRVLCLMTAVTVGLIGAVPAAAQQNPLPDKAASVVIGAPDYMTSSSGNSLSDVNGAYDAAIDPVSRKVFVLDRGNYRILRFADYRSLQNGDPAEHVFGGDCAGTPAASSTCIDPAALEFDDAGRLWVADNFGRLLRYDNAATSTSAAFTSKLGWNANAYSGDVSIWDIVITGTNRDILIAHDIQNYQFLYWDISGTPANNKLPYQTQPASLYLQDPGGHYSSLAHDYKTGGLWTLDYYWGCVRYYADPEDLSQPQGVIGDDVADCQRGTGEMNSLSATQMSLLAGLWASADGTLFVGDYNNYRILTFRDAAARSVAALAAGEFVSADAVYGAADLVSYGYDDPTSVADPAEYIGYLEQFSGDPTNNTLVIPMEYPSSVRLFITPEIPEEEQTEVVQVCDTLPDMAITPERVELAPGGSTSFTVTMRNLCNDRPFQSADLLVSLSDGLSVGDGSPGMLNLGQRAAWQQISLAPGETRSWTLTTQAAAVLPTPPVHVVELYYLGGVAKRTDGVFVTTAAAAPAPAPVVEAPAPAPAPQAPPALPAALPNTAEGEASLPMLPVAALLLTALGGALLVLRRR